MESNTNNSTNTNNKGIIALTTGSGSLSYKTLKALKQTNPQSFNMFDSYDKFVLWLKERGITPAQKSGTKDFEYQNVLREEFDAENALKKAKSELTEAEVEAAENRLKKAKLLSSESHFRLFCV